MDLLCSSFSLAVQSARLNSRPWIYKEAFETKKNQLEKTYE